MLLESAAFKLMLLLLLLLLLMLLLMLITSVRMPKANEAKSTALEPLTIDVLDAWSHATEGGLYNKGELLALNSLSLFL